MLLTLLVLPLIDAEENSLVTDAGVGGLEVSPPGIPRVAAQTRSIARSALGGKGV